MKKIIIPLLFILSVPQVFAQGIAGDWAGLLTIPQGKIHLVFHIRQTDNTYTSTLDSPDQGAAGLPTDKTTVTGNQLVIEAAKFGLRYSGTYQPDSNQITGTFTQGPMHAPLVLTHSHPAAAAARPQDPKDFPYKQEEVIFSNPKAGNQLAGTLTQPSSGKVSKIVVLITGSGAQNRNEELLNHRPFLVWSDWLTRNGIAVLRYDDRGVGKSTGNFAKATTADFADDAEAAVNYILSRPDLKTLSIGLMGHSEGGLIAPMVASRNPAVKFIVLLAGPGVPIPQLMLKQTADIDRAAGASDEVVQHHTNLNQKLYALVAQGAKLSSPELKQQIDTVITREMAGQNISKVMLNTLQQQAEAQLLSPWYRYFLTINPTDYLTKVKCPVLALDGTKDLQVNSTDNLAAIKTSLEKAGNKHFETTPMEGLNHLFQQTTTGRVDEYEQLPETVNPAALSKVSGWIGQL